MNLYTRIIVLTGVLTVTGCATNPPTFSDRVLADSNSRADIAEKWDAGKDDLKVGEKRVSKGKKLIEKGHAYISKGEKLIASGNEKVQNNRQAYQVLSLTIKGIDSSKNALNQVSKLKDLANEWEEGEEEIFEGKNLIERGNASITEGEDEIENGQDFIEKGKEKMKDAESLYDQKAK